MAKRFNNFFKFLLILHRAVIPRWLSLRRTSLWPETQRQATQHACLPTQVAGRMGTNKVKRCTAKKIIFCTWLTRAAKAGQKSIVPSRINQPNKEPSNFYSLSPHSAQYQQSAGRGGFDLRKECLSSHWSAKGGMGISVKHALIPEKLEGD
jgi:hypothetical protein